jgi:hypothetical protein
MKNFIITSISLVFLTFMFVDISQQKEQSYIPIDERISEPTKGAKGALEYLHRLKANADGEIPVEAVLKAREQVQSRKGARSSAANTTLLWTEMGPDNVGGRTRAILIDKDNSNLIYAGGVSGGLWKSTNAGLTWKIVPGTDQLEFSGVVSICQTINGDIYFGTGEGATSNMSGASNGASAFIGGGIYKSTDGVTFSQLESTAPNNLISTNFDFASVTEMAAHKTDPNTLYAATRRGIKVSTDGGQSWQAGLASAAEFFDVEVANDGSVFASTSSGIFYSEDGTAGSFSQLASVGATFGGGSGRIEIALSPSDVNYVYAVFSNQGGLGRYKGIYRSTDKGETWDLILPGWSGTTAPTYNIFNQQANYAMAIAVDPQNKDRIIVGGLDLWEFEYGVGIEPISYWAVSDAVPFYVHADHHEILFDESNPGRIYFGHDGGVSRSDDNGVNFITQNRGYGVTQFYTVDYSKDGKVIGGTQDNGTQYINFFNNISEKNAVKVAGGDGGYTQISYINPDIIFSESQNGSARRSADGGLTNGTIENFLGDTLAGLAETADDEGNNGLFATFINPMHLWEEVDADGNPIDTSMFFAATTEITQTGSDYCVYMTKQALDFSITPRWFQVTPKYASPIERISVTPDGNHMFFSWNNNLYRTDNLNLNVDSIKDTYKFLDVGDTNDDPNGDNSNAVVNTIKLNTTFQYTITDIAVDPNDKNNIVVTVGGYGSHDHVYKSTNAMSDDPTFTPIQGNLPYMPAYSAVIDVNNASNIIIGTEFGVWTTTNGNNWILEDDGMPIVPCHMLRQQHLPGVNKGVVYVGTHGRGIFKSSNTSSIFDYSSDETEDVNLLSIYPNPAESFINLELTSDVSVYDVSIIDLMGKEVYKSNSLSNPRIDISSLEIGNYIIVVNSNEGKQLGKFVKTK